MALSEIASRTARADAEPAGSPDPARPGGRLSAIPAWAQRSLGVEDRPIQVEHHAVDGPVGHGAATEQAVELTGRASDDLVVHETAHVRQHANRSLGFVPDVASAEAEAADLATAQRTHQPLWVPQTALPAGHVAHDDPKVPPELHTSSDESALDGALSVLDRQTDPDQRRGAVTFVVALAMKDGPAQKAAGERLQRLLSGDPDRRLGDHMAAVEDLKPWLGSSQRAYDYALVARLWYADHSKDEIGSALPIAIFQNYLHHAGGRLAIDYLRRRILGTDPTLAQLAARIVADLLERASTPEAAAFAKNYAALQAMATANGWGSYGPLAVAAATGTISSALSAVREEAGRLARLVRIGPVEDAWAEEDQRSLNQLVEGLSRKGLTVRPATQDQPAQRLYSAENREEVEHDLIVNPTGGEAQTSALAETAAMAADRGARLEQTVTLLHSNVAAMDAFLSTKGGATPASDERAALLDVRHELIKAWLSFGSLSYGSGSANALRRYAAQLEQADQLVEHFDQAVAKRKFTSAHTRFLSYQDTWAKAKDTYPGNRQLDEEPFFAMRESLDRREKDLQGRFRIGVDVRSGQLHAVVTPGDDLIPTDLRLVSALDQATLSFGLHATVMIIYTANLALHNAMLAADIGSKDFRQEQGKRLWVDREQMVRLWNGGHAEQILELAGNYQKTLQDVGRSIERRAKIDFLINLGITLVAALVTEGAALAVRLASLSEIVALARTARTIGTYMTLVEVGAFTATELTAQSIFLDKDITAGRVAHSVATNLAFVGALKLVGGLTEPLAKGAGNVRKLVLGHLVGFSGTAAVSATLQRIETGKWPADVGAFLVQTASTYLAIAGMHHAFAHYVSTPALKAQAGVRLETLRVDNEALLTRLRTKVEDGSLTPAEFEAMRAERIRLLEEVKAIGEVLRGGNALSADELTAIHGTADTLIAQTKGAPVPVVSPADPVVRGLPAPESVSGLVRVGETNTYVFDPTRAQEPTQKLLARYEEKGFKVEGGPGLRRVLDPSGDTVFLLRAGPAPTALLLAPGDPSAGATEPLARATGLQGPALERARAALTTINRDAQAKLVAEYSDYSVVSTFSLLVENAVLLTSSWSIDAVRGLADLLTLERGVPRSAVRRLLQTVPADQLSGLFESYHEIATSPNVAPGTEHLVAEDLRPSRSVGLIKAWRQMMAKGIELPADMDRRAVRGIDRQLDKLPGGWLSWLAGVPKAKRAEQLRVASGLVDPSTRAPTTTTEVLALISADIPGHPELNPMMGASGEEFVTAVETRGKGRFGDAGLRQLFVMQVNRLRLNVALAEQGTGLEHGQWEPLVGLANEVRRTARLILDDGVTVLASDGGRGISRPTVSLSSFTLPNGSLVTDSRPERNVHLDLFFADASGRLTAMELTTGELGLPEPLAALDPKNPAAGGPVVMDQLNEASASHRKWIQAIKIIRLNQIAQAIGGGAPAATPTVLRMSAGDFSVPAARALEGLGFTLELSDGTPTTAAEIALRKGRGPKP